MSTSIHLVKVKLCQDNDRDKDNGKGGTTLHISVLYPIPKQRVRFLPLVVQYGSHHIKTLKTRLAGGKPSISPIGNTVCSDINGKMTTVASPLADLELLGNSDSLCQRLSKAQGKGPRRTHHGLMHMEMMLERVQCNCSLTRTRLIKSVA